MDVPLASNFILGCKEGKEAFVQPIVRGDRYRFNVRMGLPPPEAACGTKAPGRGANFRCIVSDTIVGGDYIKAEGQAGRMGQRLMALVAEGSRCRIYLSPTEEMEATANKALPAWKPSGEIPARLTGGTCVPYGLREWKDIFTARPLCSLVNLKRLRARVSRNIFR